MSKRFVILSILAVAIIAAVGSALYPYRPNAARQGSFRTRIRIPASNQLPASDSSQNRIQSINTPDFTGMTPPSPNTNQFVNIAEEDLAARLKISLDEISLLKITDIDWQDITQGCTSTPGQSLTKGKLSGYSIWLEAEGKDYAYHIGLDGKIFLCPN